MVAATSRSPDFTNNFPLGYNVIFAKSPEKVQQSRFRKVQVQPSASILAVTISKSIFSMCSGTTVQAARPLHISSRKSSRDTAKSSNCHAIFQFNNFSGRFFCRSTFLHSPEQENNEKNGTHVIQKWPNRFKGLSRNPFFQW